MPLNRGQIVNRSYLDKCLMTISEEYTMKSTMVKERAATRTHVLSSTQI